MDGDQFLQLVSSFFNQNQRTRYTRRAGRRVRNNFISRNNYGYSERGRSQYNQYDHGNHPARDTQFNNGSRRRDGTRFTHYERTLNRGRNRTGVEFNEHNRKFTFPGSTKDHNDKSDHVLDRVHYDRSEHTLDTQIVETTQDSRPDNDAASSESNMANPASLERESAADDQNGVGNDDAKRDLFGQGKLDMSVLSKINENEGKHFSAHCKETHRTNYLQVRPRDKFTLSKLSHEPQENTNQRLDRPNFNDKNKNSPTRGKRKKIPVIKIINKEIIPTPKEIRTEIEKTSEEV